MKQGGPTGWTLVAVEDCDLAGIPIPKGATVHVYPGTARPIVMVCDLPPNYGAIGGLLCDEQLVQVTGPSPAVASLPPSPALQLLPTAGPRRAVRCTPRRSSRARLALVR
jgi:hypothetical protein